MKKSRILLGVLLVCFMMGCGNRQEQSGETEGLYGTVRMVGSTSMQKLASAAQEVFMARYPGVKVTAEFTGSGAGILSVVSGNAEIGNSSRNLTEEEKEKGAVENVIALDGIAIVVDPKNVVSNLSRAELIAIYTGQIKTWDELGGSSLPIVTIGREAGAGTRSAFEAQLAIEGLCVYANELDSTGAIVAKVAAIPGAIGYVSLDVVTEAVKMVSIDGVSATRDNIKSGAYALSRPFIMATKGKMEEQSEAVQTFFSWMQSEEGKAVIKHVGLVPVD